MQPDLARCLREQAEAAAALDGPDSRGAWMGVCDWVMEEAILREGQLPKPYYEHAGITIYHGDCREILPHLPSESVDVLWTDPPYDDPLMLQGKPQQARCTATGMC